GISLPEGIPAAADIVNLRYKSCSEMEGQDHLLNWRFIFIPTFYTSFSPEFTTLVLTGKSSADFLTTRMMRG
ncbi:hypothetical protein ACLH2G_23460, partial [Klebsiella michiganensis]|uniref:hypothetical protein n=1 Tax=Klebsiella michiganensis TaxID=1134687 RepID=UPI003983D5C2